MDAKKTIMKFIKPHLIPVIVLLIIPIINIIGLIVLLCATLPTLSRAKKSIAKLEANGVLDKAAEEMISANAKHLIKGNAIFTENYMFCKRTGLVFTYDEIMWAYKHRLTHRFLMIPIHVTDSLYLATKSIKPRAVASMGKDKKDEIKNAILEIYYHNNKCLVGYTNETVANYKAMTK